MKISSVENISTKQNFGFKFPKKKDTPKPQKTAQSSKQPDLNELFTADIIKPKRTLQDLKSLYRIQETFTDESDKIFQMASQLAQMAHSEEVETWHYFLASLLTFRNYLSQAIEGTIDPMNETLYNSASCFPAFIYKDCTLWDDKKLMEQVAEVFDKHIKHLMDTRVKEDIKKHPQQRRITPRPSANAINEIRTVAKTYCTDENPDFLDSYWFELAIFSSDKKIKQECLDICFNLRKLAMIKKGDNNDKHHIEFYDTKADAIWKNIVHGNNVVVLSDFNNMQSMQYLQNSFINLINKPNTQYGAIDPKKTQVILLSDKANFTFIDTYARKLELDKSKQDTLTVFFGDLTDLFKSSDMAITTDSIKTLHGMDGKNGPNIKFVLSASPETYRKNTQNLLSPLAELLQSYAQQTLPILNAKDAKKYLTNESGLAFIQAKTGKKVTVDAINRSIEITSSQSGNFPEKAINLLRASANFFVDETEITSKHIEMYIKETEGLSEVSTAQENSIIFDTGKTLNDIKGMPMTLEGAQSIARQISNGTIGTRGIVIFHEYGGANGGGRRHCVESIAGQTQVPMLVINAKDFALKDIDALSQEASLSEAKISKIFQMAKAQASANKKNTAIIYIENFDNFGSNPLYGISSIYEQKAFIQLLSEMDAARKEGKVNIVVIGSANMPETLDENILKPYKFLNRVVVYQPQDARQRKEILNYYIEKNNLKIAGENEEQRQNVIQNISESTQYFSAVDLIYLLDCAKNISIERDKDAIDGSDFIEAFLQTTSGITNTAHLSDDAKKIVSSHEAGHALVLQIMYEIAQKQNISWHLPQKVDFITLDPRGSYGGAMYYKDSENEEYSFERVMSDIASDYGGHSSENIIYNMRGSWGITADMENAAHMARLAVTQMGMGKNTGVKHIIEDELLSESQKEIVNKDTDIILKGAKTISNIIVSEYKDFIIEFSEKYYSKVATGECVISSKEFCEMLNDWRKRQSSSKIQSLEKLERRVLEEIQNCKRTLQ